MSGVGVQWELPGTVGAQWELPGVVARRDLVQDTVAPVHDPASSRQVGRTYDRFAVQETREKAAEFAKRSKFTFPVLLDRVGRQWELPGSFRATSVFGRHTPGAHLHVMEEALAICS